MIIITKNNQKLAGNEKEHNSEDICKIMCDLAIAIL